MIEIALCPYCGKHPERSFVKKYNLTCITLNCVLNNGIGWLPPDWDTLCADVKKGREYDHVKFCLDKLDTRYQEEVNNHDECVDRLDTAVRLLGCMPGKAESNKVYVSWLKQYDTFLALPPIKKIVDKQKGQ